MSGNGFHTSAGTHTDDGPPVEPGNEYQLYKQDTDPCQYFLAVNGSEAKPISGRALSRQPMFRDWHIDHGLKAPLSKKRDDYEKWISHLQDHAKLKEEPLPFLRAEVQFIEKLSAYFNIHIPNMVRASGQEYLDGKVGQDVRVRMGEGRIYFKDRKLTMFCKRSLMMNDKDIVELKMFIQRLCETNRGGFQGEQGARDWMRWTYWVRWDLFDEETRERWQYPDGVEGAGTMKAEGQEEKDRSGSVRY